MTRRSPIQVLRNQGANNAKQPTPETGHSACRSSHRRRECLGRPSIQDGIKHGLKEVLEGEKTLIFRYCVGFGE